MPDTITPKAPLKVGETHINMVCEKLGYRPLADAAFKDYCQRVPIYDAQADPIPGFYGITNGNGDVACVHSDSYVRADNNTLIPHLDDQMEALNPLVRTVTSHNDMRLYREYLIPGITDTVRGEEHALRVIYMNSHDGLMSFQAAVGFLSFVCLNTCISGSRMKQVRIAHRRRDLGETAIEGLETVMDHAQEIWTGHMGLLRTAEAVTVTTDGAVAFFRHFSPSKAKLGEWTDMWDRRDNGSGSDSNWSSSGYDLANLLTAWASHSRLKATGNEEGNRFDRQREAGMMIESHAFRELVGA